jgi:hypothetical protein
MSKSSYADCTDRYSILHRIQYIFYIFFFGITYTEHHVFLGRDHLLPHTLFFLYFHKIPYTRSPVSYTFDQVFLQNLPNLNLSINVCLYSIATQNRFISLLCQSPFIHPLTYMTKKSQYSQFFSILSHILHIY